MSKEQSWERIKEKNTWSQFQPLLIKKIKWMILWARSSDLFAGSQGLIQGRIPDSFRGLDVELLLVQRQETVQLKRRPPGWCPSAWWSTERPRGEKIPGWRVYISQLDSDPSGRVKHISGRQDILSVYLRRRVCIMSIASRVQSCPNEQTLMWVKCLTFLLPNI